MECPKCGKALTAPGATCQWCRILSPNYAGFWKRFAACFIDALITGAVSAIVGLIVRFQGAWTGAVEGTELTARISGLSVEFLGEWIYFAAFESSPMQATLGKMALGIKVTDLNGDRIGFGKASGRYFGKIVSTLTLFIGFIMVAFTKKKQGLHDIMAGCLVVNK